MTDYYEILRPAILALDPNTSQTRLALYNRARKLIADRSEMADAALSATDFFKELHSLDLAVRRIEAELAPSAGQESDVSSDAGDAPHGQGGGYLDQPRRRMLTRLAAIVLITCVLSIAGLIGVRYWVEENPEDGGLQKNPQAQRELAEIRDGMQRSDELPYTLRRQLVYYRTSYPLGTLIISKSQKFLYLVRPNVAALRYSIGIGRKCTDSVGLFRVSQKEKWSSSTNAARGSEASTTLAIRTENPLGAGALHLEDETHRIHGISKAVGFGSALGCFQLVNDDIVDLIDRVPVGTKVVAGN